MTHAVATLACTGIVTGQKSPFMAMGVGSVDGHGICMLATIGHCLETPKTITQCDCGQR
jgi:hypothetical protein